MTSTIVRKEMKSFQASFLITFSTFTLLKRNMKSCYLHISCIFISLYFHVVIQILWLSLSLSLAISCQKILHRRKLPRCMLLSLFLLLYIIFILIKMTIMMVEDSNLQLIWNKQVAFLIKHFLKFYHFSYDT